MALAKQSDTIINTYVGSDGKVVYSGVRVQAFLGAAEQQLYSDASGTPIDYVQTDDNGLYEFWIEEGTYNLRFSVGGVYLGGDDYRIINPVSATEVGGLVDQAETAAETATEQAGVAQEAATDALSAGDQVRKATWAELAAVTTEPDGRIGVSLATSGTHTSLAGDVGASGGQTPDGGQFRYTTGVGWVRLGDTDSLVARAWASSPTPPDPTDPTSKSAKGWALDAENSAVAAAAGNNYRATISQAISDFPVGTAFISPEVTAENPNGEDRRYIRVTAAPGYELTADQPVSKNALAAPTGADFIGTKLPLSYAIAQPLSQVLDSLPVSITNFGAVGNSITGDTAVFEAAVNSGKSIDLSGRTVFLSRKVRMTFPGVTVSNGTIKILPWDFSYDTDDSGFTHFRAIFVEAANITFNAITMDADGVPMGTGVENGFIWSTAPSTAVTNCQFLNMSKGTCVWLLGNAPYAKVIGNTSLNCSGLVFVRGRDAVVSVNIIINATDAAIALNALICTGVAVTGNIIDNQNLAVIPAMIAVEEGASQWTITGNVLLGANGGGIVAVNVLDFTAVRGGIVANNTIRAASGDDRPVSPNPAALLSISQYYYDIIVTNNIIEGCPSGNGASRLVSIPATATRFTYNVINGSDASGIDALVSILSGDGGVLLAENRSTSAGGLHYLLYPGDYANAPVRFKGGEFYGNNVEEGINANVFKASITNLKLYITDIAEANTIAALVNAPDFIGDRGAFLNAGAWQYPHRIADHTVMYGTGIPTTGGTLAFQNGDRISTMNPAPGGREGWVKVAGGTPWVEFGNIG